jgi:hypothetical protein
LEFEWRPELNPKVQFWVQKNMRENRTEPNFDITIQECHSSILVIEGNARMSDLKLQQELACTQDALSRSEAMVNKTKHQLLQA